MVERREFFAMTISVYPRPLADILIELNKFLDNNYWHHTGPSFVRKLDDMVSVEYMATIYRYTFNSIVWGLPKSQICLPLWEG